MRIIIALEPSINRKGYDTKYAPLLSKHIDRNHFQTTIICSQEGSDVFDGIADTVVGVRLGPTKQTGPSLFLGYMLYMIVLLYRVLSEAKKTRPHVILSLGGHIYSGLIVTVASKFLPAKSIIRISEPTRTSITMKYSGGGLLNAVALLEEMWVLRHSDGAIANRNLDSYFPPEISKRISIISQGADPTMFYPGKSTYEKPGSPHIVSISRLSREKNVGAIVDAIASLRHKYPDIRLSVIGAGPLKDELLELCESLGVLDYVAFLGHVSPPSLIPDILRSADVFVLASRVEGLPSAMLEAMSTGALVISSEIDAVNGLIVDGVNGFLFDLEPANLSSILQETLALSRPERARVCVHARKTVVEKFSWSNVAKMAAKVYLDCSHDAYQQ